MRYILTFIIGIVTIVLGVILLKSSMPIYYISILSIGVFIVGFSLKQIYFTNTPSRPSMSSNDQIDDAVALEKSKEHKEFLEIVAFILGIILLISSFALFYVYDLYFFILCPLSTILMTPILGFIFNQTPDPDAEVVEITSIGIFKSNKKPSKK